MLHGSKCMLNIFKKNNADKTICKYCNAVFLDHEHLEKHTKRAHAKGR
ncbi:MAG: hypothetical protein KatS3mg003_0064 [Candidatus Nitrosocaldaceae archaeon]|nr:MAG: hypothetical protein KatS3mg003_0064 [Candidatus Nitrosocaldaceae archaeon]